MQTAGIILDLYDDHQARVLREKLGGVELPQKLASMDMLSPEDLDRLPNRVFGLVARNGDETLRKFAMHNEPHLVTSLIYFTETGHLLPEEAQKVAAHNLCLGCHWYGVEPTDRLVKLAGIGRAVGGALAVTSAPSVVQEGMDQKRATMDSFRRAQATGVPGVKTADLTGTEMMPAGGTLKGVPLKSRTDTAKGTSTAAKTASGRLLDLVGPHLEWKGPIDITGQSAPVVQKLAEHQHYALKDRYPIATPEQVKQASVYLDENWGAFTPVDRHVYATNVQDRADSMGLGDLGGMVREYAGREYGTKVAMELQGRIRCMDGKEKSAMYEALLEKVGELSPYMMAEMLEKTDALTGLDESWNTLMGHADPYRAVFSKTADDARKEDGNILGTGLGKDDGKQWSWNQGSDFVNDVMLEDFANNGRLEIAKLFGDDFAAEFCKDPISQFEALPDPQKHVMARLAATTNNSAYGHHTRT